METLSKKLIKIFPEIFCFRIFFETKTKKITVMNWVTVASRIPSGEISYYIFFQNVLNSLTKNALVFTMWEEEEGEEEEEEEEEE